MRARLIFRIKHQSRFRVKINHEDNCQDQSEGQGQLEVKVGFLSSCCWKESSPPPPLPPHHQLHWPNLHNPGYSFDLKYVPLITSAKSLFCLRQYIHRSGHGRLWGDIIVIIRDDQFGLVKNQVQG